ncbi:MAG: spermidine/putrescine ABC transporter substrate-binding protein, partial [Lacrimispora sphenoides]
MKKKLSKIMAVSALSLLSISLLSGCGKSAPKAGGSGEVYVYNWGEYIDESVIEQFEQETGIKVVYDMFETNEEMYPVIEAGGVKYDAVC